MFDTRNDLPANVRVEVSELLNARLADAIDLGAQSKYAHWNVKGPNFIALHELFDKVAESVEDQVDIAPDKRRIACLNGVKGEAGIEFDHIARLAALEQFNRRFAQSFDAHIAQNRMGNTGQNLLGALFLQ